MRVLAVRLQRDGYHVTQIRSRRTSWDGAPVRLHVTRQQCDGFGDGSGRLRAWRAEVVAEGRGRGHPAAQQMALAAGPVRQDHRRGRDPQTTAPGGAGEDGWRRTGGR